VWKIVLKQQFLRYAAVGFDCMIMILKINNFWIVFVTEVSKKQLLKTRFNEATFLYFYWVNSNTHT